MEYNFENCTFLKDKELLDFATSFSEKYKECEAGSYSSENMKYNLDYVDIIIDKSTNNPVTTCARIAHSSGVIELSKRDFMQEEYTSDFLFLMIIWCVTCREIKKLYPSESEISISDKIAFEYYVSTGRSKKNAALGFLKMTSNNMSSFNMERYRVVSKILKEEEKVQE